MKIEATPATNTDIVRDWTNDLDVVRSMPRYIYLPTTIMREFGHAYGIGHDSSSASGSVMTHGSKSENGLSSYDAQAMRAVLSGIDSHD